jgi:hypothetical protein
MPLRPEDLQRGFGPQDAHERPRGLLNRECSPGISPITLVPGTGRSSATCWTPISASPDAIAAPTGRPCAITALPLTASAMPRLSTTVRICWAALAVADGLGRRQRGLAPKSRAGAGAAARSGRVEVDGTANVSEWAREVTKTDIKYLAGKGNAHTCGRRASVSKHARWRRVVDGSFGQNEAVQVRWPPTITVLLAVPTPSEWLKRATGSVQTAPPKHYRPLRGFG